MRKYSFRRSALLSLVGVKSKAAAEPPATWTTPSHVDDHSTATLLMSSPIFNAAASSTDTLVERPSTAGFSFETSQRALTRTLSGASTIISPTGGFGVAVTLPSPDSSGAAVTSATRSQSTRSRANACPAGTEPTGHRKMGFAGAIAGAAGVFVF